LSVEPSSFAGVFLSLYFVQETMALSLQQLSERLQERLLLPLPGGDAHEPFRAHPIGDVRPLFDHAIAPKPGGVIILLFEDEGILKFPLIKRAEYAGTHSGQVSLPGGKAEPGENSIQTALRECEEEIGVDRNSLTVLGHLSDFFVMPSNFMVTPVIATAGQRPVFKPDPYEVARILEGDISSIIRDDAMKQKEILVAGKYKMMAPHFEIDGEVVWGATAMMLNELRLILREIMNGDSRRS
jgi:8-oxo-dGTP pyrophosphatase MutT (NUDIX family)